MTATADSRMVRMMGIAKISVVVEIFIERMKFPSKDISMCPAIKLAVSRTHKVMGRINELINSIKTMSGINPAGVLCGRR